MHARKRAQLVVLVAVIAGLTLAFVPYLACPSLQGTPWGQPGLRSPYVQSTRVDRLVFTYYFYWYDWAKSNHFHQTSCQDDLSYHPVNLEGVSYLDPNWHYREVKDMIAAGIDVILPDFWGGNGGSGANTTWDEQGLGPLQMALDRLHAEQYNAANARRATNPIPKVALFFDTTCMKILYPPLADLENETQCDTFYRIIQDFYSFFDESHVQQVPHATNASAPTAYIVWLYGADYFSRLSQACLDACAARFLADCSHSLIFIGTEPWRAGCPDIEGTYHWGTAIGGAEQVPYSRIAIASLGAGMNNGNATVAAVCHAKQPVRRIPRTPEYYAGNWTQALLGSPNWVVVETWNELYEGTAICRTEEYGDQYINFTGQFSQQFHQMPLPVPAAAFLQANPGVFFVGIALAVVAAGAWQWKRTQSMA